MLENIEVPETYAGEFEVELSREDAEGTWYFGDNEISSSSKYSMSSRRGRHSLSVKDVKKEDQGKYTFVCGDLRTCASLKMKCKQTNFLNFTEISHVFQLQISCVRMQLFVINLSLISSINVYVLSTPCDADAAPE